LPNKHEQKVFVEKAKEKEFVGKHIHSFIHPRFQAALFFGFSHHRMGLLYDAVDGIKSRIV
jgi:hypothetical protein